MWSNFPCDFPFNPGPIRLTGTIIELFMDHNTTELQKSHENWQFF